MAVLTEPQKMYLVQRFSSFDSPQQAADALRQEFGVEISRAQAVKYDPESHHFGAAQKYRDLYKRVRERFVSDTSDIAVAQKSYRLRELQRLYQIDLKRGSTVVAAKHLEQAAKEMGDAFSGTRKFQHTGAHGGPIRTVTDINKMTREEVLARLDELRGKQSGDVH